MELFSLFFGNLNSLLNWIDEFWCLSWAPRGCGSFFVWSSSSSIGLEGAIRLSGGWRDCDSSKAVTGARVISVL